MSSCAHRRGGAPWWARARGRLWPRPHQRVSRAFVTGSRGHRCRHRCPQDRGGVARAVACRPQAAHLEFHHAASGDATRRSVGCHRDRRCVVPPRQCRQSSRCSTRVSSGWRGRRARRSRKPMSCRGGSTGWRSAQEVVATKILRITAGSSLSFTPIAQIAEHLRTLGLDVTTPPRRQGLPLSPRAGRRPPLRSDPSPQRGEPVPFPPCAGGDTNRSYWSCRVASLPRGAVATTEATPQRRRCRRRPPQCRPRRRQRRPARRRAGSPIPSSPTRSWRAISMSAR